MVKSKKTANTARRDLLTRSDDFFGKRITFFFILSLVLTIFIGLSLFDLKPSVGGDDSTYLVNAKKFIEGLQFPSHLGAGYPIFISVPMQIFGFKLGLFKFISFLFIMGMVVFMYISFKDKISATFLALTLLFISVNSHILYFGSQTYSEALFMFLQIICIYLAFKLIDKTENIDVKIETHWKLWLFFGFASFCLGITRMVGYGMFFSLVLYFLLQKKYRASLFSAASFFIFFIPYTLYKRIVWDASQAGRLENILYKNVYNKAAGKEDFAGMLTRFYENANSYISKHLSIILGLKDPASTDKSIFVTLLFVFLFLIALYFAFKKHKKYLFTGIYLLVAISGTFISLQQMWDQRRMIIIFVPLLLPFLFYGVAELSKLKQTRFLQLVLIFLFAFFILKNISLTNTRVKENRDVLTNNLRGHKYYGYTPDWENFLKMSEWVGKNIPEDELVASRKPSMSFIYSGGRNFFGIYKFPVLEVESYLNELSKKYDPMYIVNAVQFRDKMLPAEGIQVLRQSLLGFVVGKGVIHNIYYFDPAIREPFANFFHANDIAYDTIPDVFLDDLKSAAPAYYAVSPDTLAHQLKYNQVDYIIQGSLRINPKKKTDRVINTIHRYIRYTEVKYPGMFRPVHQIGDMNGEPAQLFKVNYDLYNIR